MASFTQTQFFVAYNLAVVHNHLWGRVPLAEAWEIYSQEEGGLETLQARALLEDEKWGGILSPVFSEREGYEGWTEHTTCSGANRWLISPRGEVELYHNPEPTWASDGELAEMPDQPWFKTIAIEGGGQAISFGAPALERPRMFRALELIGSSLRFMRPLAVVKNSEDCLRNFIIYGREEVFSSVAKELIVMGAILESQLNGGEASVQSRLGGSQDLFMHLQCVGQALSSVAQHGDGRKYWDNEFQSYRPLPEPAPPEKMVRGFEKTFPED